MGFAIDPAGAGSGLVSVGLLGGLRVSRGDRPVRLSGDGRRLVALLALERTWVRRAFVAGTLWLDVPEDRAFGNLRSALWRVRAQDEGLILTDHDRVSLCGDAFVDVESARNVASALFAGLPLPPCHVDYVDLFAKALLPGWYDDFVVDERELLREQALHALEALAERLSDQHQFAEAMRAAMAAIRLDRLRESAHRRVICIHIAEGNHSAAQLQYDAYADYLEDELGLAPSAMMDDLVNALPTASQARRLRRGPRSTRRHASSVARRTAVHTSRSDI